MPVLKRFLFSVFSVLILLSGCAAPSAEPKEYTLRVSFPETSSDLFPYARTAKEEILSSFCEMGFVCSDCSGWSWEMALSINDVTETYPKREAWSIEEPSGRVFQIHLNPEAVWEDGTPIDADSYMQSMRFLLDPQQNSAKAIPYLQGPVSLCRALHYVRSGTPEYIPRVPYYETGEPAQYPTDPYGQPLFLHLRSRSMTLSRDYSIEDLMKLGYVDKELYAELDEQADAFGYIPVSEDNLASVQTLAAEVLAYFGLLYSEDSFMELLFIRSGEMWPEFPFSQVGLQKSGTYELLYITESSVTLDEFQQFMTENWLIHPSLYENPPKKDASPTPFLSYGPYRLDQTEEDGTLTLIRSETWYGYTDKRRDTANYPTRIRCFTDTTADAVSLWERGFLDLVFMDADYPSAQASGSHLQHCDICGKSFLISPRLETKPHHCAGGTFPLCCYSLLCSDAEWEIYRSERGGFVILPQAPET